MPIPAPTPLALDEVPATAAKTYPDLWLDKIVIGMPTQTEGFAQIQTRYYDGATGEILTGEQGDAGMIFIRDLPAAIAAVPEVAAAMGAIIAAIEPLRTWQDAQNAPVEEPAPEEDPAPDPA
jgi:hypothetical protein